MMIAIFLHAIWKGLDRHIANRAARRYVTERFQPSTKRNVRSVCSLKHDFERTANRYVNEADYSECLRQGRDQEVTRLGPQEHRVPEGTEIRNYSERRQYLCPCTLYIMTRLVWEFS
jgi:hypothetical protein